jgi:hypothetical protein
MDQKAARRVALERRIGGNLFIVIALVMLIFNTAWADAIALVFAIIGVGFRIEAAIANTRLSDRV